MSDEQTQSTDAAEAPDEVTEAADELSQMREQFLRARADYENLKRRSAQDVRDRVQQSQRGILLDLIELADDFERADREAPADPNAIDPWRQGVELIAQKLQAMLLRQQVQPIDTVDQPFDPEFHEAVGQLPGRSHEIVAVLRTGYTQSARVLRATQVMVGDGSIASAESADTDQPNQSQQSDQSDQSDGPASAASSGQAE